MSLRPMPFVTKDDNSAVNSARQRSPLMTTLSFVPNVCIVATTRKIALLDNYCGRRLAA